MNPRIDRRTLLVGVGVGAASGILGARARAASTADVAALSKRFRETPRDAVLDVAAKAIAAALEAFDPDRADRALTALFRRAGVDDIFEILWPFAARSFTDAGHRIIHSAQIERTIRQVDSICTLPALRTIVLGLADDAQGPATESFTEARAMA